VQVYGLGSEKIELEARYYRVYACYVLLNYFGGFPLRLYEYPLSMQIQNPRDTEEDVKERNPSSNSLSLDDPVGQRGAYLRRNEKGRHLSEHYGNIWRIVKTLAVAYSPPRFNLNANPSLTQNPGW